MTLAKLVKTVIAALEEIKAHDIEVFNVAKLTTLCDRMIIASGDSSRQTLAIANNVVVKVKAAGGTVYGVEGEQTGEWVLVDLGDVLVHVMQTAVRAHYNLEELWADTVKISRKTASARTGTGITPSVDSASAIGFGGIPASSAASEKRKSPRRGGAD
ncbi:MAG: ribosome silencing factor [Nitrosospira sp.]|nr:ribosome silencing factor [Nitrosospira sp.]